MNQKLKLWNLILAQNLEALFNKKFNCHESPLLNTNLDCIGQHEEEYNRALLA